VPDKLFFTNTDEPRWLVPVSSRFGFGQTNAGSQKLAWPRALSAFNRAVFIRCASAPEWRRLLRKEQR